MNVAGGVPCDGSARWWGPLAALTSLILSWRQRLNYTTAGHLNWRVATLVPLPPPSGGPQRPQPDSQSRPHRVEIAGACRVPRPVLVVDDDPDCRIMLATLLECAGFPVATAADGRAALAECRRQPPCLILLDLMM